MVGGIDSANHPVCNEEMRIREKEAAMQVEEWEQVRIVNAVQLLLRCWLKVTGYEKNSSD